MEVICTLFTLSVSVITNIFGVIIEDGYPNNIQIYNWLKGGYLFTLVKWFSIPPFYTEAAVFMFQNE